MDFRIPNNCGQNFTVTGDELYRLVLLEKDNSTACDVNMRAIPEVTCNTLCYRFNPAAEINNEHVAVRVTDGTTTDVRVTSRHKIYLRPSPNAQTDLSHSFDLTQLCYYVYFDLLRQYYREAGSERDCCFLLKQSSQEYSSLHISVLLIMPDGSYTCDN